MCFTLIKLCKRSISELFNKNRSRNINERLKWCIYSLKSTKFPEIWNVSWMKPVIPSHLFKTYKTLGCCWYSCVTLPKLLTVMSMFLHVLHSFIMQLIINFMIKECVNNILIFSPKIFGKYFHLTTFECIIFSALSAEKRCITKLNSLIIIRSIHFFNRLFYQRFFP